MGSGVRERGRDGERERAETGEQRSEVRDRRSEVSGFLQLK